MDRVELEDRAGRIRWYHSMDLGQGFTTQGRCSPEKELKRYALPEQLQGLSVLDIGAWDGFFSFECKRRGASRVLATDFHEWGGGGWGSKAGFELAREALSLEVEDQTVDVLELDPTKIGQFDLVLFLGVLYHMRHPLLALERLASVTRSRAIVETVVEHVMPGRGAMVFYPSTELSVDDSNWWGPNELAVRQMLLAAGFRRVERVSSRPRLLRLARAARNTLLSGAHPLRAYRQDRMTFCAWK